MPTEAAAAFLDRDGVINREHGYLHRVEDFEFLPGVVPALRELQRQGFLLAVATNQSGIARGYYTQADYEAVTAHMVSELARQGVQLAAVAYCPHLPDAAVPQFRRRCGCRKPEPGMLLELAARLHVDTASSILVGDKLSDIQAGRAAGVGRCYLVRSGHALDPSELASADAVFDDLAACVAGLRKAAEQTG
jgi:D-glycero-D-manno-heptose 1,7-bisphosphate phosphatase